MPAMKQNENDIYKLDNVANINVNENLKNKNQNKKKNI